MKNIFYYIKIFFVLLFLSIFISNFASFAVGPGEQTEQTIAIVGDSYAGYLYTFLGSDGLEYYVFPTAGIDNAVNLSIFKAAIERSNSRYILFCSGVNDYVLETSPQVFENHLRDMIKLAGRNHKYIFFHTYMNFPNAAARKDQYIITSYNDIYQKLAKEYSNVNYIDMSNLETKHYAFGDGLHYGKIFYETLYSKLIYLTDSIEASLYISSVPWILIAEKDMLTVTGDSYAGTFVRFEDNKDFKLLELARSAKTIEQNSYLMSSAMMSNAKYILISIGVNDFEKQTSLESFEDSLRFYLNLACKTHKKVFLHTYMHFQSERKLKINISEYDKIIKKLADEYPNTVYIDLHVFEKAEFQMPDLKHYDKTFYDIMYNNIVVLIDNGF